MACITGRVAHKVSSPLSGLSSFHFLYPPMKRQGGENADRGFSVWERRSKDELAIHLQSHKTRNWLDLLLWMENGK